MAVRALTALLACTTLVAADDFHAGLWARDRDHAGTNDSDFISSFVAKLDDNLTSDDLLDEVSRAEKGDVLHHLTDLQYYSMPQLFWLDEWAGCVAAGGLYCRGSFELAPAARPHPLFATMQRFSDNWVHHFNHTRLHRGLCVSRRCAPGPPRSPHAWFAACVNQSTVSEYNLTAHLYQLDYCQRGPEAPRPLDANQKAFAGCVALLLGLATLSSTLDLMLSDKAKKGLGWALSWSLARSWRALTAPAAGSLAVFDGLRVFCLMCVIIEHVGWIGTLSYVADTRTYEQMRLAGDVILMTNSTLVVQIFFLMASFLLAHKLLRQETPENPFKTFGSTMLNRIIRISPSYFFVVWFASSWWERLGAGPQWAPLVGAEAAVCRRKWWTQLLYLNNLVHKDDKCLIQTWYLAADMQLYAAALALTLALRGRRCAVPVLAALLAAATAAALALAYAWRLVPTLHVHRPESVRVKYSGDASFNTLYQSPLGNAAGTLAGLLLAHGHHAAQARRPLASYQLFRWASVLAAPAAGWWAAASPLPLGAGPPSRAAAAALAALERPVFSALAALALLGAINGVPSPWRTWFSRGAVLARLSFGALLLHIPLNEALIGARLAPVQLDRQNAILEWFGVACLSFAAAVPLALLVELPAQALLRELGARPSPPPPQSPPPPPQPLQPPRKPDKTDT